MKETAQGLKDSAQTPPTDSQAALKEVGGIKFKKNQPYFPRLIFLYSLTSLISFYC